MVEVSLNSHPASGRPKATGWSTWRIPETGDSNRRRREQRRRHPAWTARRAQSARHSGYGQYPGVNRNTVLATQTTASVQVCTGTEYSPLRLRPVSRCVKEQSARHLGYRQCPGVYRNRVLATQATASVQVCTGTECSPLRLRPVSRVVQEQSARHSCVFRNTINVAQTTTPVSKSVWRVLEEFSLFQKHLSRERKKQPQAVSELLWSVLGWPWLRLPLSCRLQLWNIVWISCIRGTAFFE